LRPHISFWNIYIMHLSDSSSKPNDILYIACIKCRPLVPNKIISTHTHMISCHYTVSACFIEHATNKNSELHIWGYYIFMYVHIIIEKSSVIFLMTICYVYIHTLLNNTNWSVLNSAHPSKIIINFYTY
jgi:hypothetical protein